MPTASSSGWTIPSDSDPLGNGAQAIRDLVDGIEAAWTAYTPTWTGSGSNPAIGNGSVVGRYKRIGKTIIFRVIITAGSTTTFGTGNYSIGLPVAAHATGRQVCHGDIASGSTYSMRGRIEAGASTTQLWTPGTVAGGADRTVTPTVPAALANGSVLVLEGTYEAA
jgi:hypothetical protein